MVKNFNIAPRIEKTQSLVNKAKSEKIKFF